MKTAWRIMIVSVGLLVLGAPSAFAEIRQASPIDSIGDATFATDAFAIHDAQLLDVASLSVSYDSTLGKISASFRGRLPNEYHGATTYALTLAEPSSSGACGANGFTITAQSTGPIGSSNTAPQVSPPIAFAGTAWADPYAPIPDKPGLVYDGVDFYVQGESLKHRDFRCVTEISATRGARFYLTSSVDTVAPVCLTGLTVPRGDCFAATTIPSPAPPTPGSPASNNGSASGSGTNVNVQVANTIQVAGAYAISPVVVKVSGGSALRKLAGAGLAASLTCPSDCKASGRLTRHGQTLATAAAVQGRAGKRITLHLRSNRKQLAKLRRLRAGSYTLRLTAIDGGGHKTSVTKTLKLS